MLNPSVSDWEENTIKWIVTQMGEWKVLEVCVANSTLLDWE